MVFVGMSKHESRQIRSTVFEGQDLGKFVNDREVWVVIVRAFFHLPDVGLASCAVCRLRLWCCHRCPTGQKTNPRSGNLKSEIVLVSTCSILNSRRNSHGKLVNIDSPNETGQEKRTSNSLDIRNRLLARASFSGLTHYSRPTVLRPEPNRVSNNAHSSWCHVGAIALVSTRRMNR